MTEQQVVAYISRADLDRLLADKWAVVEVTAYQAEDSENIPLLVVRADGVRGTVASRAPDIRGTDEMDLPQDVKALPPGEAHREPGLVCGRCGCADLVEEK